MRGSLASDFNSLIPDVSSSRTQSTSDSTRNAWGHITSSQLPGNTESGDFTTAVTREITNGDEITSAGEINSGGEMASGSKPPAFSSPMGTDVITDTVPPSVIETGEQRYTSSYTNPAVLYGIPTLMGTGLLGNTLSFMVIMVSDIRKTSTGVYLATLAWFDSLALVAWMTRHWVEPLGKPFWGVLNMCNVRRFFLAFATSVCALTVVCVTSDRFIAVWFPLQAKLLTTPKKAGIVLLVVVTVSLLLFFPSLVAATDTCSIRDGYINRLYDRTLWYIFFNTIYYGATISLLILNAAIAAKLVRSPDLLKASHKKTPKVAVTVLAVSVAYVVCVLPFNVVMTLAYFPDFKPFKDPAVAEGVLTMTRLLIILNHGMNFFLYIITSRNFRRSLVSLVLAPFGVCRDHARQNSMELNSVATARSSVTDN